MVRAEHSAPPVAKELVLSSRARVKVNRAIFMAVSFVWMESTAGLWLSP